MAERARGKHRVAVENDIIRKREKDFRQQQMWGGALKYYDHFNKVNTKFEEWTSPRYYEDNTKLYTEIKTKRDKEDLLVKRREKLRKLLEEEEKSYEIEVMVHKNREKTEPTTNGKFDVIPSELLSTINNSFKEAEETKRRHEAETRLYHQWRMNNPIVRNYERAYNNRNMKLSWLDQQIEKRMKKEKEEEEAKRVLKEREELIKKQKELEEQQKKQIDEKNKQLKEMLDEQMEELMGRQAYAEELKKKESDEMKKKMNLVEIEEKQIQEEKRRLERECALYNIRQHKLKLKQKAADIQENLAREKEMILKLKQLELEDIMQNEKKRIEIKRNLDEFYNLIKEQQDLEKKRQKQLEFIFDSEAKHIYDRQCETWKIEEDSRQKLLKDVIATVKQQMEWNIEKNKEKQLQVLKEREENTERIEMYNTELERLKEESERKKIDRKKSLEEDIKVKNARKLQQENFRLRELDEELERIKKEEERLQKEIMNIQRKHGTVRPNARSRLFY